VSGGALGAPVALLRAGLGAIPRRAAAAGAAAAAVAGVAGLSAARSSGALLYPDGYQYLLMARGIAEHGRPVTRLGPGGDLFVPSVDAAAKPLYPLAVALAHGVGRLSWTDAARLVSAVAAVLVILLCGLLAARLTRSGLAGAVAAGLCLASPSLAFWDGMSGPDPMAQALLLGAALALVCGRGAAGGILAAACVATRPEYAALAIAASVAAACYPRTRETAARAAVWGLGSLAVVLAALRPPIAVPTPGVAVAGAVGAMLAGAALLVPGLPRRRAIAVGGALIGAGAAAALVHGVPPGVRTWLASDWPLAVAALALGAAALALGRHRAAAFRTLVLCGLIGAVYLVKNPASDRYVAQLVPALAILAALGIAALAPRRRAAAVAVAAVAAAAMPVLGTAPTAVGPDMFGGIAARLSTLPGGPIVTAAPDAYGFLLPARAVRALRPGARGLIVLDAAQRTYEPELTARGTVIARIPAGPGFLRPDGVLDDAAAVVVDGAASARAQGNRGSARS